MQYSGGLSRFWAGACMAWALALAACSSASTLVDPCVASNTCFVFAGQVQDEKGQPVANASVAYHGAAPATPVILTTDAAGRFRVKAVAPPPFALQVTASGFAKQSRYLAGVDMNVPVVLVLRPLDLVKSVTLAPVGGDAVNVTVTRADGAQTILSIPGGAMVDPTGQPFAGDANVNLAFWSASSDLSSIPGPLLAVADDANARDPTRLETFGMADIEVMDAATGNLLQVAPGMNLGWTVVLSPATRSSLASRLEYLPAISLYSMDMVRGLWVKEGTMASGALTYDNGSGTFAGQLPHLTPWNIDGAFNKGCVAGTVTCKKGGGAPTHVNLWIFEQDSIDRFTTTANSVGHFCLQIGSRVNENNELPPYVVSGEQTSASYDSWEMPVGSACSPFAAGNYDFNGQNDQKNPSKCDPGASYSYAPFGQTYGGRCNNIQVDKGGDTVNCLNRNNRPLIPQNSSCDAGASAKCAQLGTIDLCGCTGAGCATPAPACTPKLLAQNCNMGAASSTGGGLDDCCNATLACSDFVCVQAANVGQ